MPTESGDMKLLGNFRKLIDHVSGETTYKPSNNDLKPTALEAQYTAAQAATQDVPAKMASYKAAINDRLSAYDALDPIVMRARNMLKASGADKNTLDNAETHVRKLLGRRKSAKPKADPNAATADPKTPAPAAAATHSASQLSFDNKAGNLDAFIEVVAGVTDYKPNEADLKVTALRALSNDLKSKNNAVSSTFVPLSQARGTRDQLLYEAEDSVVNTALLVKAYVSAAFGRTSQLYKQIKGLKFDRPNK
ncbi:MAG TPA: hypothetical protein VK582_20225 [Pyrinomonadaceae bacterium]|nr:hypothetical protein [Pyrinomonadaceae bacterium]